MLSCVAYFNHTLLWAELPWSHCWLQHFHCSMIRMCVLDCNISGLSEIIKSSSPPATLMLYISQINIYFCTLLFLLFQSISWPGITALWCCTRIPVTDRNMITFHFITSPWRHAQPIWFLLYRAKIKGLPLHTTKT